MWDKPEPTFADVIAGLKLVANKVRGDATISYKHAVRAGLCVCDYGACQIPEGLGAMKGDALSDEAFLAVVDSLPDDADALKGPILDQLVKLPWKEIIATILQFITLWV